MAAPAFSASIPGYAEDTVAVTFANVVVNAGENLTAFLRSTLDADPLTVLWGLTSLTKFGGRPGTGSIWLTHWSLENPTPGTHDLVVTFALQQTYAFGLAYTYANANLSGNYASATPFQDQGGTGTPSYTNPDGVSGGRVVGAFFDYCGNGDDTWTPDAGCVVQESHLFPVGSRMFIVDKAGANGNVTISGTLTNSNFIVGSVLSMVPAAAGGWGPQLSDQHNRIVQYAPRIPHEFSPGRFGRRGSLYVPRQVAA